MTDNEYKQWLRSPSSIKCILAEAKYSVGGVENTAYLSNFGYVTSPDDAPANTAYKPILVGGLDISASMEESSDYSISWGDIEIDNTDGRQDKWLSANVWRNKDISVYLGDPTWARSDFRLIFTGKIEDLVSPSRSTLSLIIRDKLDTMNTSISEEVLGGISSNKDTMIPLCFGECHNVKPLLIDPVALRYQVHTSEIERIIEVRDNGVPVDFTANLANGTFVLTNSPVGNITCSVQGAKFSSMYYNDVSNLVKNIVKTYGIIKFTDADIDLTNFASFAANNTQAVGIYLDQKSNVITVVNELASSIGAKVVMTPVGKLQLQKIDLPSMVYSTAIGTNEMKDRTFKVSRKLPVAAAVNLNYCKNYAVQENLQTGLPTEHTSMFAREWLESKASDSAVALEYTLSTEVTKEDTLLLVTSEAQTEATRRLNLRKVQRYIYSFDSDLSLLLVNLGDYVQLTNSRYGLSESKIGQVVSININWFENNINFGVLV